MSWGAKTEWTSCSRRQVRHGNRLANAGISKLAIAGTQPAPYPGARVDRGLNGPSAHRGYTMTRCERNDDMKAGKLLAPVLLGALWMATSDSASGKLGRLFRGRSRNNSMGRRLMRAFHLAR